MFGTNQVETFVEKDIEALVDLGLITATPVAGSTDLLTKVKYSFRQASRFLKRLWTNRVDIFSEPVDAVFAKPLAYLNRTANMTFLELNLVLFRRKYYVSISIGDRRGAEVVETVEG
jgi:hypothetical protein